MYLDESEKKLYVTGRLVLSFLLQVREEEKGALALAQPLSFYPTDEQNFICSVISDNVLD